MVSEDGKGAAPRAQSSSDEKKAGKVGHKIMASVAAAGSAVIARKALTAGWRKLTGKEPPEEPTNPDTRLAEAAGWAAASAGVIAAAQVMARRKVAATWRSASGELPPGLTDNQK
jgi:hypothetical protein